MNMSDLSPIQLIIEKQKEVKAEITSGGRYECTLLPFEVQSHENLKLIYGALKTNAPIKKKNTGFSLPLFKEWFYNCTKWIRYAQYL